MEPLLVELLRAHPRGAEILLALVAVGALVSFVNGLLPAASPLRRYLGPLAGLLDRLAVTTMPDRPKTLKLPGTLSPNGPPEGGYFAPPQEPGTVQPPALDESKGEVLK